jgi:hypothetical protein
MRASAVCVPMFSVWMSDISFIRDGAGELVNDTTYNCVRLRLYADVINEWLAAREGLLTSVVSFDAECVFPGSEMIRAWDCAPALANNKCQELVTKLAARLC